MRLKRLAWFCAAASLLLLSAQARAGDKVTKETFEFDGVKRTYYLFAPSALKPQSPLILLLHGSGRNGLTLVDKWKELAAREGFVVAGPDSSNPQTWLLKEEGPDFMRALVDTLSARYRTDPRRVYLFGHSAGAIYSLNMAMLESEYFAAVAVHAGAWREPEEYVFLPYAKRKIPLAIFVGDRDEFFPLAAVRSTESALKERGFDIRVTVMKGHNHWYYDLAPDINRSAWDFLKQHALASEPRFQVYAPAAKR